MSNFATAGQVRGFQGQWAGATLGVGERSGAVGRVLGLSLDGLEDSAMLDGRSGVRCTLGELFECTAAVGAAKAPGGVHGASASGSGGASSVGVGAGGGAAVAADVDELRKADGLYSCSMACCMFSGFV
jgi:hypothetical protein